MMNAKQFEKLLIDLYACGDGRKWARGKTLAKTWDTLDRPDWMLWLIGKMAGTKGWPTRNEIILLAADCAEMAMPIFEKRYPAEKRVRDCIKGVRDYVSGKITLDELKKLRSAAYDAAAAAYADTAYDAA